MSLHERWHNPRLQVIQMDEEFFIEPRFIRGTEIEQRVNLFGLGILTILTRKKDTDKRFSSLIGVLAFADPIDDAKLDQLEFCMHIDKDKLTFPIETIMRDDDNRINGILLGMAERGKDEVIFFNFKRYPEVFKEISFLVRDKSKSE